MRKLGFIQVLCLGVFISVGQYATAQIKNDKGTFEKPVKGNLLVETNMTPNIVGGTLFSLNDLFLQNLSNGLNKNAISPNTGETNRPTVTLPLLKGRYFIEDNMAIRSMINVAWGSITVDDDGDKFKLSETGFAIAVGIEKHLTGAERLSTYIGGDILFGLNNFASSRPGIDNNGADVTFERSQSGIGFGIRGVTGFDYYFIPKVYLGMELGYGLMYKSYGVLKASGGTLEDGKEKSSEIGLSPFINPALRLGFRF